MQKAFKDKVKDLENNGPKIDYNAHPKYREFKKSVWVKKKKKINKQKRETNKHKHKQK